MPQKIMDVLMLGRCSHEFAWPRRASDGEYYQICILCAAEYKYDWASMRRTERVEPAKPETGIRRSHSREKRQSWKPRARRLKLEQPIRYRVNSTSTWYDGTIDNLSQTGLSFRGPDQLPANTLVELVFEMPEEISGQANRSVICQGRVIRATATPPKAKAGKHSKKDSADFSAADKADQAAAEPVPCVLAASIVDYKFIR